MKEMLQDIWNAPAEDVERALITGIILGIVIHVIAYALIRWHFLKRNKKSNKYLK